VAGIDRNTSEQSARRLDRDSSLGSSAGPPPRLRRRRRSTIGRTATEPDDDRPLVRAEDSRENDSVVDSEETDPKETDPEAGKVFDVPDPDTSRVVAPELIDPERRAQHRRWMLDRLERWIP
jgi:hypothetical protein